MKRKNSSEGFTIVEVALVLAIAGLIFLMVFIALPAVQRTQRDAKRRDDVGTLLTAIQKYQNNNRGSLPSDPKELVTWENSQNQAGQLSWYGFYASYLGQNFEDPKGFTYKLSVGDCNAKSGESSCSFGKSVSDESASFDSNDYTMYIVKRATCDGSQAAPSNNPKKVAVLYKMEGSGGAYCANTQ